MSISDWIQFGALFIAIIGFGFSIYSLKNQIQVSIYAEYTKRYQDIILNFPENINEITFDIKELCKDDRDKTLRYMRAYFDLCSEEFDLMERKYVDKGLFNFWKSGIEYALTKTAFQSAWMIISKDSKFNNEFENLANKSISISK